MAITPVIVPQTDAPFKEGARVIHKIFGTGTVRVARRTGGGNWVAEVEFDERSAYGAEKFSNSYRTITTPFLEKFEDPYADVEFGTNVLDLVDPE